jgi:hypothetical protein
MAGMDQGRGVGTMRRMQSHDVCQARDLDAHPNALSQIAAASSALSV